MSRLLGGIATPQLLGFDANGMLRKLADDEIPEA